jgi:hypothetical protein
MMGVNPFNFAERVYDTQQACLAQISDLQKLINRFVADELVPVFGNILSFQQIPTLRFNFAVDEESLIRENDLLESIGTKPFLQRFYLGGPRFANFHCDRDYGLMPGSINLWIPVTGTSTFSTIWIGGSASRGQDAAPVQVSMGQALMFDGANRWHGVVWNTSGETRVSFDIRFLPEKCWKSRDCSFLDTLHSNMTQATSAA